MYFVEPTEPVYLETYYKKYAPLVQRKFNDLLNGGCLCIPIRGNKNNFRVYLSEDSTVRNFIKKYIEDQNLRRLLIGNFKTLTDIIDEIKGIDKGFKTPISKKKHGIKDKGQDFEVEDDIHAIFHQLLVRDVYENSQVFDKNFLAKLKNLSICPYCGASEILPYKNRYGTPLGYQIEHYLPKSKYPYFAISFYNLFPACKDCNDIQAKGVNSPLAEDERTQCLMHPNEFDNSAMNFGLNYNGLGFFNEKNFSIFIDFHGNRYLCNGYNDIIPIENKYKTYDTEVRMIWNKIESRNKEYFQYMKLQVDETVTFDNFFKANIFFGFDESVENSREIIKYKFKTEILHTLLEMRKSNSQNSE